MLLNGRAPLPGQIMKFQNLAKTFRALAEHGKDGFYRGRIAESIVELIKSKGGVMELEDLAKHSSSFVEPIKYTYSGEVTVYEVRLTYPHRRLLWAFSKVSCSALRTDKVHADQIQSGLVDL
jgi:gamma-glutamyltranspeptidase